MNAAITSVYIVIALCTPVTVVFRSATICEIETFITLESSTMMNWADSEDSERQPLAHPLTLRAGSRPRRIRHVVLRPAGYNVRAVTRPAARAPLLR